MIEKWKDSVEFPTIIEVSNTGKVRTKDRNVIYRDGRKYFYKGHELAYTADKQGYLMVTISFNNKVIKRRVHRLVATTFIPNKNNKPEVNHINGIKTDNNINNLEWVTPKENVQHAIKNNLRAKTKPGMIGEKNPASKLKDEDVKNIRFLRKQGFTLRELAEKYKVCIPYICYLCKSKYRKLEN